MPGSVLGTDEDGGDEEHRPVVFFMVTGVDGTAQARQPLILWSKRRERKVGDARRVLEMGFQLV